MGKKKGKGKNKLSRMSEEERARYLQHRADMEEEARRRKQQLIALYMKNKLKREEAFTRLNMAKINHEWRVILRQIKCKELYDELKETENIFAQSIERKNIMIRKLLCDLDGSEELYATMLHSHMETIDRLIRLHYDRLSYYRDNYYNEKRSMLQRFKTEMKKYDDKKSIAYEDLECITIGQEYETKERHLLAEESHMTKIDRIRNMV